MSWHVVFEPGSLAFFVQVLLDEQAQINLCQGRAQRTGMGNKNFIVKILEKAISVI